MNTPKKIDFEFIFENQKILNERINPTLYKDINDPEIRKKWFLNFTLALQQEVAESIDSLNWKWWKKTPDNWDNVKIELVDILHFWISMCQMAGMNADEVLELYMKKNKLNHDRQDQGYKQGTYQKIKNGKEDNEALLEKK